MAHSKWALYDALIEEVDGTARAERCFAGPSWILVDSEEGTGMAMRYPGGTLLEGRLARYEGARIRDLAELARSWDFGEASIGVAALNSWYNSKARYEALTSRALDGTEGPNTFDVEREGMRGRKVTVVGHFPDVEAMRDHCRLTVLERRPQEGDTPDSACEYILHDQDYVIITGTTLINKTLPRLLELAVNARVILVGPSVPFYAGLFHQGVDLLGGVVVTDRRELREAVAQGSNTEVFFHGATRVQIPKESLAHA